MISCWVGSSYGSGFKSLRGGFQGYVIDTVKIRSNVLRSQEYS